MFGLDTMSLLIGIVLGWFVIPMIFGFVKSKTG